MKILLIAIKKIRTFFFTLIARISCGWNKNITANGFSWLGQKCKVGTNCNFNGMRIYGNGNVTIGNNFHSGKECMILTSNHNYEGDKVPYDATNIDKDVIIGDQVWIGSRVIVLPGAVLGDGCIIQAGSVVTGTIPPLTIAGGHPAIVFSERNKEHYERLILQKKFF